MFCILMGRDGAGSNSDGWPVDGFDHPTGVELAGAAVIVIVAAVVNVVVGTTSSPVRSVPYRGPPRMGGKMGRSRAVGEVVAVVVVVVAGCPFALDSEPGAAARCDMWSGLWRLDMRLWSSRGPDH